MKELYIKQKLFSLGEKFTVKDQDDRDVYYVEGSFLQIPKTFTIMNTARSQVALITKKVFSFLPKFYLEVDGREILTIKKEFTFLKSHYSIDSEAIDVRGDWWDMDFEILRNGRVIGEVNKEWFTLADRYRVRVYDEAMETVVIAIVVTIDCVKADQAAAASSSGGAN